MNERVPIQFSVTGISYRRAEETYTARVEIVWGIQATPYVFTQEIVGVNSLTDEQRADTVNYPDTIVVPGFSFVGTGSCQVTPTIYTDANIFSGVVSIKVDETTLYENEGGEWVINNTGQWAKPIPGVITEPTTNFNGSTYYVSYPLYVGDPEDTCGDTIDPTEPPTGGEDPEEPSVTPTPDVDGGNMAVVDLEPTASTASPSLPGCVTLTEWPCETEEDDACVINSCDNPFFAIENQDDCGALTVTSVRVEPASLQVAEGRRGLFRVVAVFSDGREGDVTASADLQMQDSTIASILTPGVVGGLNADTTVLNVAWKGLTASAVVEVTENSCSGISWDVVLVMDQATAAFWFSSRPYAAGCGIYWRPSSGSSGYVAEYGSAALALMLAMSLKNPWDSDAGGDRIAIVVTGDGEPVVYTTWTDTIPSVTGLCQMKVDSRLGEALEVAQSVLESARSDASKMVVLYTAGSEAGCSPSARSMMNSLGGDNVFRAVVTPVNISMPWTMFSPCTYPETAYDYLESLPTSGLFFSDTDGLDGIGEMALIPATACNVEGSGYY